MNIEEMVSLVQCYIHHMTGKQIVITKPRGGKQYFLLTKAYAIAKDNLIL